MRLLSAFAPAAGVGALRAVGSRALSAHRAPVRVTAQPSPLPPHPRAILRRQAAAYATAASNAKIEAGTPFPELVVKDRAGGEVDISKPGNGCDWMLVVVYRGAFCPLCTKYIGSLAPLLGRFREAKVDVAVVSADGREQLEEHVAKMDGGDDLPIYYGLTIEQMQKLGLYVSYPWSERECDHPFAEPGVFVINEKGNVHIADISNAPFARPDLADLAFGVEFIRGNDYPIRGTYP